MDEKEFQKKVLDGTEALAKQQTELTSKYDNLQKETKQAFEDLTKLKNTANDQAAILLAIKKVQLELRNETRMAWGDPVQRIVNDEQKRTLFNARVRAAVAATHKDYKLPESCAKALAETSSPGSTLINAQLDKEIYDTLQRYGVWSSFKVKPLGTRITKYPVKTARPVANWLTTESSQISDDTNKAGASVDLTVLPCGVLLNVSRELIEDAEFDVTADIMDDFGEAFAYRLDYTCLNANAAVDGPNGGYTGIFSGGTAAVAAAGNTTVETLELRDIINAILAVDAAVLQRPAKWWMHPQTLIRLLNIKDLNGRPIFLTALEAPAAGSIGSILGYPIVPSSAAPTTNVAGSVIGVFGDPSGLVVGMRSDFSFEASDDFKFDYFQRSFRGVGRAGIKIRRAQAFAKLTTAAN